MVPLPEVLCTATASKGLLAEISYTFPLTVVYWACTSAVKEISSSNMKPDIPE